MSKILVVDDSLDLLSSLNDILCEEGYTVLTAIDAETAIKYLNNNPPDLLICDLMMPEIDGYVVIQNLLNNPETRDIPFIIMTAKTEKDEIEKALSYGSKYFLTKPFNISELLNIIKKIFANSY